MDRREAIEEKIEDAQKVLHTQAEELEEELEVRRFIERRLESIVKQLSEFEPVRDENHGPVDIRDVAPIDDRFIRALENANIWEMDVLEKHLEEWSEPREELQSIPGMFDEGIQQIDEWLNLSDYKEERCDSEYQKPPRPPERTENGPSESQAR